MKKLFIFLFLFLSVISCMPNNNTSNQTQIINLSSIINKILGKKNDSDKIKYSVIYENKATKVIVISPEDKDYEKLKKLGEQLKNENIANKFAFIFIYDSIDVAKLFENISLGIRLSNEVSKIYDDHFLGTYTKNESSGCHELCLNSDPIFGTSDGKVMIIKY